MRGQLALPDIYQPPDLRFPEVVVQVERQLQYSVLTGFLSYNSPAVSASEKVALDAHRDRRHAKPMFQRSNIHNIVPLRRLTPGTSQSWLDSFRESPRSERKGYP